MAQKMKTSFQDKPVLFPEKCADGRALKPITQVLLDRRATSHFKPDPVPEEYLEAILQFGTQAPSGYNLQPWRFIVVREKANRERLQKAAFNQEKVGEAPVNIIAFAIKNDWKNHIDEVFHEGVRRGDGKPEMIPGMKKMAWDFLEKVHFTASVGQPSYHDCCYHDDAGRRGVWPGHGANGRF